MTSWFQKTYNRFQAHKGVTATLTVAFMLVCIALFFSRPVHTDIQSMIPSGKNGALAKDLSLLTHSSLAGTLFITIRSEGENQEALFRAADTMKGALKPPHFIVQDTGSINPAKVSQFLINNAPNLLTAEDLDLLEPHLSPQKIQFELAQAVRQLSSPMGMIIKPLIQQDPINMRALILPKLAALRGINHVSIVDGHMVSEDGRSVLIMAQSDIPVTSVSGAEELLLQFDEAARSLPTDIHAELVSPHLHTFDNAETIQSDLLLISGIAGALLLTIYWFYFRSRSALAILIAPALAMSGGMGGLGLFYESTPAIVIGFGAVLIGMALDFSIHVFFALQDRSGSTFNALAKVSRPILTCCMTSCVAFGALLLSDTPGIRQLAIFSIFGLGVATFFSLFILPLFCTPKTRPAPYLRVKKYSPRPKVAIAIFILLLFGLYGEAVFTKIEPDMRAMDAVSESTRNAEEEFSRTWGAMRDRGIFFTSGTTLEYALISNENTLHALNKALPETSVTNIATIFPSFHTQANNRGAWQSFWSESKQREVSKDIHEASRSLGFTKEAFAPFYTLLNTTPSPISPEGLDAASLGVLRKIFMPIVEGELPTFATFLPDTTEVRGFFTKERESELNGRYVSNGMFKDALESTMRTDIVTFISASGIGVILFLLILFRNGRRTLLALIPPCIGVGAFLCVMSHASIPLNLFHIAALPLIIGLGADYGIFMVRLETEPAPHTHRAVTVSGLSTLAGFGVLAFAHHPALHAMGTTVLLGVGASLAAALILLPHLIRRPA